MYFKDCSIYQNESGIYIIKNLVNNKIYVGQTTMKFIKRFWHHRWMLANNGTVTSLISFLNTGLLWAQFKATPNVAADDMVPNAVR